MRTVFLKNNGWRIGLGILAIVLLYIVISNASPQATSQLGEASGPQQLKKAEALVDLERGSVSFTLVPGYKNFTGPADCQTPESLKRYGLNEFNKRVAQRNTLNNRVMLLHLLKSRLANARSGLATIEQLIRLGDPALEALRKAKTFEDLSTVVFVPFPDDTKVGLEGAKLSEQCAQKPSGEKITGIFGDLNPEFTTSPLIETSSPKLLKKMDYIEKVISDGSTGAFGVGDALVLLAKMLNPFGGPGDDYLALLAEPAKRERYAVGRMGITLSFSSSPSEECETEKGERLTVFTADRQALNGITVNNYQLGWCAPLEGLGSFVWIKEKISGIAEKQAKRLQDMQKKYQNLVRSSEARVRRLEASF